MRAAKRRLPTWAATAAENLCRVEISLAPAHADMQPITRGAEFLSLPDPFASAYADRRNPRVRHSQTVGMAHRDMQSAAYRPGEADDSIGRSPERRAGLRRELETAIAGSVRALRRPEGVHDGAVHRPDVAERRPRLCGHGLRWHRLCPRRAACDSQYGRARNSECNCQARGCADSYTSRRRSLLTRV